MTTCDPIEARLIELDQMIIWKAQRIYGPVARFGFAVEDLAQVGRIAVADALLINPLEDNRLLMRKAICNMIDEARRLNPWRRRNVEFMSLQTPTGNDEEDVLENYLPDQAPTPAETCAASDMSRFLRRMTADLVSNRANYWFWSVMDGRPQVELSAEAGCTEANISRSMSRTRQLLMSIISEV